MANDSPLGLAGLKTAILTWLMPPPDADHMTAAARSAKQPGSESSASEEPDREALGPGRGRTLYIRA
jgi:hypothetical protein